MISRSLIVWEVWVSAVQWQQKWLTALLLYAGKLLSAQVDLCCTVPSSV
jgi:hypothetical protein